MNFLQSFLVHADAVPTKDAAAVAQKAADMASQAALTAGETTPSPLMWLHSVENAEADYWRQHSGFLAKLIPASLFEHANTVPGAQAEQVADVAAAEAKAQAQAAKLAEPTSLMWLRACHDAQALWLSNALTSAAEAQLMAQAVADVEKQI